MNQKEECLKENPEWMKLAIRILYDTKRMKRRKEESNKILSTE
jgi:hypothetical protein